MVTEQNSISVPEGFERITLGPGYTAAFGPIYVRKSDSRLGFRVAEHHLNPMSVCHGGAMATFADMQVAMVKIGIGTQKGHMPTIHLDVDYLAPAPLGSWVEMSVTLVKTTRNLVFTQALITADGDAVARSTGIYKNASVKPPLN